MWDEWANDREVHIHQAHGLLLLTGVGERRQHAAEAVFSAPEARRSATGGGLDRRSSSVPGAPGRGE